MPNQKLVQAVCDDKIDEAKKILLEDAKSNLCWHHIVTGNFPLHIAVENKSLKMVEILLQAGADASLVNNENRTPIEYAAEAGQWDCVQYFVKFLKDKQGDFHFGRTLFWAVLDNQEEIVQLLAEAGACLKCVDSVTRDSCLHIAVENKNSKMVEILLLAGADASVVNNKKKTPIEYAAKAGQWDCVQYFVKFLKDKQGDFHFGRTLFQAVLANRAEIVKLLVAAGAGLTCFQSVTKDSCLHIAVKKRNTPMVRILLEAGAKAWVNEEGKTPIQCAAETGQWNCVLLLERFGHEKLRFVPYSSLLRNPDSANGMISSDIISIPNVCGEHKDVEPSLSTKDQITGSGPSVQTPSFATLGIFSQQRVNTGCEQSAQTDDSSLQASQTLAKTV